MLAYIHDSITYIYAFRMHTYVHTYIYIHSNIHKCMQKYMHTYVFTCLYKCIHMHIQVYTHKLQTYKYTHTHLYTGLHIDRFNFFHLSVVQCSITCLIVVDLPVWSYLCSMNLPVCLAHSSKTAESSGVQDALDSWTQGMRSSFSPSSSPIQRKPRMELSFACFSNQSLNSIFLFLDDRPPSSSSTCSSSCS